VNTPAVSERPGSPSSGAADAHSGDADDVGAALEVDGPYILIDQVMS
jgi:hypothetical protein